MPFELSNEEHALLLEVLQAELGRLKGEIYKTEDAGFKKELKGREAHLTAIIGRLESTRA